MTAIANLALEHTLPLTKPRDPDYWRMISHQVIPNRTPFSYPIKHHTNNSAPPSSHKIRSATSMRQDGRAKISPCSPTQIPVHYRTFLRHDPPPMPCSRTITPSYHYALQKIQHEVPTTHPTPHQRNNPPISGSSRSAKRKKHLSQRDTP